MVTAYRPWTQRLRASLAIACVAWSVVACGTSGQRPLGVDEPPPPPDMGGQGSDPGGGPEQPCQGDTWAGPDEPIRKGQCTDDETRWWSCECLEQDPAGPELYFGTSQDRVHVEAVDCAGALLLGCDIDVEAPRHCAAEHLGTCWPQSGDDPWACACASGEALQSIADADCVDALLTACGERCESDFGSCHELDQPGYGCLCTGADEPVSSLPEPPPEAMGSGVVAGGTVPLPPPPSCAAALETYCGERCESAAGRCEGGDGRFECSCASGDGGFVTYDDLAGIRPTACVAALELTCGDVVIAPYRRCDDFQRGAFCEADPRIRRPGEPPVESFEFQCACASGETEQGVEASSCYRALFELCPDVIAEAERVEPATPGTLGARCEQASDCASGVCHPGRLAADGVCSAECTRDDDCGDGALCAFIDEGEGHCFHTCAGFAACELLNDAFEDPLYCADRVDVDLANLSGEDESGRICIPLSDQFSVLPYT